MAQDDPEKRIAGGGPAPGSSMPPPPASFQGPVGWQPPTAGRSLLRRMWSGLLAIVAVALLLSLFGSAAYNYYAYRTGSPTTATVEKYYRCLGSHSGVTGTLVDTNPLFDFFSVDKCSGSWRLGGTSQSGPILGVASIQPTGSSLDVRVRDGKAYTATAGKHSLLWMIGIAVPGLIIAAIIWWRRRTGRSSRGWLRDMAEFLDFFGDN